MATATSNYCASPKQELGEGGAGGREARAREHRVGGLRRARSACRLCAAVQGAVLEVARLCRAGAGA